MGSTSSLTSPSILSREDPSAESRTISMEDSCLAKVEVDGVLSSSVVFPGMSLSADRGDWFCSLFDEIIGFDCVMSLLLGGCDIPITGLGNRVE